ncbi:MAG: nucleoside hydrolase [Dehalococcoidia bacterium]
MDGNSWDTNPAINDASALMLGLTSPQVGISGIEAVAGDPSSGTTAADARRLLEHLGAGSFPVDAGAAKPLWRPLEDASAYWVRKASLS